MRILDIAAPAFIFVLFLSHITLATHFSSIVVSEQHQERERSPNYEALVQDNGILSLNHMQHFFGKKAGGYRGTPRPGYFGGPSGITTDKTDGKIYIVDFGSNRIQIYSSTGEFLKIPVKEISPDLREEFGEIYEDDEVEDIIFHEPIDIALNDNYIYTSVNYGTAIKIYTREWQYVRELDLHHSLNIENYVPFQIDRVGNIYIGDSCNHLIHVLDQDGLVLKKISPNDDGPYSLSFNSKNNLLVATKDFLRVFNTEGEELVSREMQGFEEAVYFEMAVDAFDNIILVHDQWLYIFEPNTLNLLVKISLGFNVDGICVDSMGDILLTDLENCCVKKIIVPFILR